MLYRCLLSDVWMAGLFLVKYCLVGLFEGDGAGITAVLSVCGLNSSLLTYGDH